MDEKTWLYYSRNAEQLHRHNPIDLTKIYAQDYDEWAAEALQLSIDTVYDGFVEGEEPSMLLRMCWGVESFFGWVR